MTRLLGWVAAAFALAWVAALAILVIGQLGLLGQPRDPLSGVYLVFLGWPWNGLVDAAPRPLWPWLAAAAPSLNLLLLLAAHRLAPGREGSGWGPTRPGAGR